MQSTNSHPIQGRSRRSQAGFTMSEVLVSLVVFTIAVVGLVAVESRGIESQRASMEMREAERVAQEVMADVMAIGFDELIERDFAGGAGPAFPYSDTALNTSFTRPYRGVPVEDPDNMIRPGMRDNFYWVGRTIDVLPVGVVPGGSTANVDAVQIEVTVLWLDYTNPAYPPPATELTEDLRPDYIIPGDPDFRPYVNSVQLRTVRINDGAPLPDGGTGGTGN